MTFDIVASYTAGCCTAAHLCVQRVEQRSRELALARFFNEMRREGRVVGDYAIRDINTDSAMLNVVSLHDEAAG